MKPRYDTIGIDYASLRRPDERIARHIEKALGEAKTVLNVGAGAGSYEPSHHNVVAVEPSAEMIAQRSDSSTVCVQANAENLPFEDKSFDASMAVLTIHHWTNKQKGVLEMRRVTRGRIVFLTFDPSFTDFWLYDYFPELITLDEGQMPRMAEYEEWLGAFEVSPVRIPHNCSDGFLSAYWRRPSAYLDDRVRGAMSSFWALGDVSVGLDRLREDLANGTWEQRYGELMTLNELDCGYRLIVAQA